MSIFSDIGIGWRPANIDNSDEQDYIRQGQKTLSNSTPYWINGSALYDPSVIVTFGDPVLIPGPPTRIIIPRIEKPNPDYNPNTSGIIIINICRFSANSSHFVYSTYKIKNSKTFFLIFHSFDHIRKVC